MSDHWKQEPSKADLVELITNLEGRLLEARIELSKIIEREQEEAKLAVGKATLVLVKPPKITVWDSDRRVLNGPDWTYLLIPPDLGELKEMIVCWKPKLKFKGGRVLVWRQEWGHGATIDEAWSSIK